MSFSGSCEHGYTHPHPIEEGRRICLPHLREILGDMPDPTNPEYYKVGGIETIDFINAKKLGFNRGNAVKYISRAGHKEKAQEILDLKKALWYVKMALHTRDPEKFPDPREE